MADKPSAIELTTAESPHQDRSALMTSDIKAVKEDETRDVTLPKSIENELSNPVGSDVDISSNSALSDINSTPSSNVFEQSSQLDSIQYGGLQNDVSMARTEVIDIPIFQKDDKTVFVLLTFPTQAIIRSINGITNDSSDTYIEYQVASAYGLTSGSQFNSQTKFLPGDYCFGLVFRSNEEANKVISVKLNIVIEPISNLLLSQMIFGLYRSLGFEPSHVLKFPIKSVNPGIPFYRKTRGEINKVVESIAQISAKLNEQSGQICGKIDRLPIHKISEITSVASNNASLLNSIGLNIADVKSQLGQTNTKLESLNHGTSELAKLSSLGGQLSELGSRVNRITEGTQGISQRVNELGQKVEQVTEKVNPLGTVQEKLKELSQQLAKGSVSADIMKQLHDVQTQIGKFQEQITSVISKNGDVEKGIHEIQSITVSDLERLLEEKDTYFNKLVEAEEHIEYLQEHIEEMEKAQQRTTTKKQHKPNFIRRNHGNSEWSS